MASVGIREFRAGLSAYIRRAQTGERVVVTVDGVPAAQLSTVGSDIGGASMDDLVARGSIVPPRRRATFVPGEPLSLYSGSRIDRALAEVRR